MDGDRDALRQAKAASARTLSEARAAEGKARARTWALPPEELGARVMDDVGRVAERRGLGVANFAAGRTVDGAGLRQLAFNVTLEGAFPDVLAALGDLESPRAKLALGGVTVAPQDGGDGVPGRVSATVSMTAFVLREEK